VGNGLRRFLSLDCDLRRVSVEIALINRSLDQLVKIVLDDPNILVSDRSTINKHFGLSFVSHSDQHPSKPV
jgi:hypothetical protein